VAAVRTPSGEIDADVVVVAMDPRRLPALASHVRATVPTVLADQTLLALDGELDMAQGTPEVVLHGTRRGQHPLVLRPNAAPDGASALSVQSRGVAPDELLDALAAAGFDVRQRVAARVDLPGADLLRRWGGSPYGTEWRGRSSLKARLGTRTPINGVYAAGAHATLGTGLPFAGLTAALVATAVGSA
jgi:UDP-galactopyranose mutase